MEELTLWPLWKLRNQEFSKFLFPYVMYRGFRDQTIESNNPPVKIVWNSSGIIKYIAYTIDALQYLKKEVRNIYICNEYATLTLTDDTYISISSWREMSGIPVRGSLVSSIFSPGFVEKEEFILERAIITCGAHKEAKVSIVGKDGIHLFITIPVTNKELTPLSELGKPKTIPLPKIIDSVKFDLDAIRKLNPNAFEGYLSKDFLINALNWPGEARELMETMCDANHAILDAIFFNEDLHMEVSIWFITRRGQKYSRLKKVKLIIPKGHTYATRK